jgi:hypothetical protein
MTVYPDIAYVLPLRLATPAGAELLAYLGDVAGWVGAVIVADGSAPDVFAAHQRELPPGVIHLPVAARPGNNGKVLGVMTAMRHVTAPYAIIADDDVRHTPATLGALRESLRAADVVRPQNVFRPRRWHTLLDEGRTLLARALGGDWPGTLAIRTQTFRRCGGYRADVLFENLELVRTVRAHGGTVSRRDDLFVIRRPPSARKYFSQRTRQAYDELARPGVLAVELALIPAFVLLASRIGLRRTAAIAAASVQILAEVGRRRASGARMFSSAASLCAPIWVAERAVTSWIALLFYAHGGMPYAGVRIRTAAHPSRALREAGTSVG